MPNLRSATIFLGSLWFDQGLAVTGQDQSPNGAAARLEDQLAVLKNVLQLKEQFPQKGWHPLARSAPMAGYGAMSAAGPASGTCEALSNCQSCGQNPECHWCGGTVTAGLRNPVEKIVTATPVGICKPKALSCDKVEFGDLRKSLNIKIEKAWGLVKAESEFKVRELSVDDAWCTTGSVPDEFAEPDCASCLARGPGYTWCNVDVAVDALGIVKFDFVSPHMCVRPDLAFACTDQILPQEPKELVGMVKVTTKAATQGGAGVCAALQPAVPPQPQPQCADNTSCDACGKSTAEGGCTWCGGKMEMQLMGMTGGLSAFGKCVAGKSATCENVEFGDISDTLKKIPGYDVKFDVVPMAKGGANEDYCTNVHWDSTPSLLKQGCRQRAQDAGWCHISGDVEVPQGLGYVSADEKAKLAAFAGLLAQAPPRRRFLDDATGETKKMHIDGGICLLDGLSFLCSINQSGVTSEFLKGKDIPLDTTTSTPGPATTEAAATTTEAAATTTEAAATTTEAAATTSEAAATTTEAAATTTEAAATTQESATTAAATTQGGPVSCDQRNSCSSCAADGECQWCSSKISAKYDSTPYTGYGIGVCQPKGDTCADVKFGSLAKFMSDLSGSSVLSMLKISDLKYSVAPLSNTGEEAKWCTPAEFPRTIAAPDCGTCAASAGGWCQAHLKAQIPLIGDLDVSPALCVPPGLGFVCNKDIFPKLPSGLSELVKFDAHWATAASQCGSTAPPTPPTPSPVCSKNLSCDTCVGKCTWCGGNLKLSPVSLISVNANLLGKCLDGENQSCANVHFGTLLDYINHIPGYADKVHYDVQKIASGDDLCTSVQWPSAAALGCKQCAGTPGRGWCEMSASGNLPPPPSAFMASLYDAMKVDGGICMTDDMKFLCSISLPGTVKSQWITAPGQCTAVTTAAPTTAGPATTTAKPIPPASVSTPAPLTTSAAAPAATGALVTAAALAVAASALFW